MNITFISRLLGIITVCISVGTVNAQQTPEWSAPQAPSMIHDVKLQPGEHLIIVQTPVRRIIRVNSTQRHTLSVKTPSDTALPFVHLRIARPSLTPPPQRFSAL